MHALPLQIEPHRREAIRPGAGLRVLVADGDPTVRLLAAAILRRAGYGVETVSDGLGALRSIMRGAVDVVLVGSALPGLDCEEIVRRARMMAGAARHTAIIGLVSPNRPEERARCRDAGMDDCVEKPIDAGVLLGRVMHHVREAAAAVA